jgi:hypothetical protein
MLEGPFGEFDLQAVENLRRNLAVFGEKANLFHRLLGFMDHLQAFAPSGLLDVMDLAQMENGASGRGTDAQSPVLDYAPVAMFLPVLFAGS